MVPLSLPDVVVVLLVSALAIGFLTSGRLSSSRYKLPPGPHGLPIVGNIFQMPRGRLYPQFSEWANKFGEIYSLRLGSRYFIVLNSAEVANELLGNRSKIYSGRRPAHVAQDILSDGQRMVLMPYGKEWKATRKGAHAAVGSAAAKRLRLIQELESCVLLKDLLEDGDRSAKLGFHVERGSEVPEGHWFYLVRRYTTSVVLSVMYGKRIYKLYDNPELDRIYDAIDHFSETAKPGRYLADEFPLLRKLPDFLAPWRVQAKKMHEWEMELWGGLLEENKSMLKAGTCRDCFVSSYLQQRAEAGHEEAPGRGLTDDGWMRDKLVAYTAATVLEAGSDTTAGAIQSFILFMLSHPYVLRRAREELDRVVGSDRMPTFGDEAKLPYLVACIKETLRRHPPAVLGVPHQVEEDDVYNNYFIPKGSVVIGNVWAIHMDPAHYPNPTAFDPDRFYKPDKPVDWASGPDAADRDHYAFGWGRRFCVGSTLAEASMFIVCARILWALDFEAPQDKKTGQPIIPDIADEDATWTPVGISVPRLFPVVWKVRDPGRQELTEESFLEAQNEWSLLRMDVDVRQ